MKPNWTYRICKWLAYGLLRLLFRIEIQGAERVPREGPVVVAANHLSFLDPLAVGVGMPRPTAFIARADLFRMPLLSWLLPRLYAIPVERGAGDLAAVKAAIRALREGLAFGIFPEGARTRTGRLQPFKTGVAAIAIRTGAKVVPVAVIGTDAAWPVGRGPRPFRKIKVVFGEPIDLADYARRLDKRALVEATEGIQAVVQRLLPEKYHPEESFPKLEPGYKNEESSRGHVKNSVE